MSSCSGERATRRAGRGRRCACSSDDGPIGWSWRRLLLPKSDRAASSPAKVRNGAGRGRRGVIRVCQLGTGQIRYEWRPRGATGEDDPGRSLVPSAPWTVDSEGRPRRSPLRRQARHRRRGRFAFVSGRGASGALFSCDLKRDGALARRPSPVVVIKYSSRVVLTPGTIRIPRLSRAAGSRLREHRAGSIESHDSQADEQRRRTRGRVFDEEE
jgi:hypothetical protein